MKYCFMFFGICGVIMLIAATTALFIGIPASPRDVIRPIEINY